MTQADRVHSTPPTNTSANNPPGPVDPTRRRLLTAAAGGAVAAMAISTTAQAAGSPADPVYAAIDSHRQTNAAHWAAIKASEGSTDWGITEKPCHDENDAFDHLIGVAATSFPGLFAKLAYLREIAENEAWMLDEREGTAIELIESFATSISTLVGVRP